MAKRRIFYIHISNHVDRRDDDFYKVSAETVALARRWAEIHKGGNTRSVGGVYTPNEFRSSFPWWSRFLRRTEAKVV